MTWYDTYEEIKTKYPDTVFEMSRGLGDVYKRQVKKGWVTIKNEPNINSNIISSDKLNINVIEADKNEGDERNILLHIGILSPFNDDPVIIIKQKGI